MVVAYTVIHFDTAESVTFPSWQGMMCDASVFIAASNVAVSETEVSFGRKRVRTRGWAVKPVDPHFLITKHCWQMAAGQASLWSGTPADFPAASSAVAATAWSRVVARRD